MEKQEIAKKVAELGYPEGRVYPKKTFLFNDIPSVGFFKNEMDKDFYFFNEFDKKLYMISKENFVSQEWDKDDFKGFERIVIPLNEFSVIWEDKPYEELKDEHFSTMTLRQYACIHLKVPQSGLDWLDAIISKSGEKFIP